MNLLEARINSLLEETKVYYSSEEQRKNDKLLAIPLKNSENNSNDFELDINHDEFANYNHEEHYQKHEIVNFHNKKYAINYNIRKLYESLLTDIMENCNPEYINNLYTLTKDYYCFDCEFEGATYMYGYYNLFDYIFLTCNNSVFQPVFKALSPIFIREVLNSIRYPITEFIVDEFHANEGIKEVYENWNGAEGSGYSPNGDLCNIFCRKIKEKIGFINYCHNTLFSIDDIVSFSVYNKKVYEYLRKYEFRTNLNYLLKMQWKRNGITINNDDNYNYDYNFLFLCNNFFSLGKAPEEPRIDSFQPEHNVSHYFMAYNFCDSDDSFN